MIRKTIFLFLITACSFLNAADWKPNEPIRGEYDEALAVKCSNGTFVGREKDGVKAWLGLPFAVPPVGELRWKDPVPAPDSDGVFEAYDFGKRSIQFGPNRVPCGEDCLSLCVYKNSKAPTDRKLPVMVWIHGGAYISGEASSPLYNGVKFLADEPDVIFVAIQYRLGPLGFLVLDGVAEGGEQYKTAGNLGLLDQACALRWVRKNISAFGGDPENITIFGESAGGGSVSFLPLIKEAKGTFQKVIAQSGSVGFAQSVKYNQESSRQFVEATGAKSVAELQKIPESELLAIYGKMHHFAMPVADGVVIPTDCFKAYADGAAREITFLVGSNADEDRLLIGVKGSLKLAQDFICRDWESYLVANQFLVEDWARMRQFFHPTFRPELNHFDKILQFGGEILFRLPILKQTVAQCGAGGKCFVYYFTQPTTGAPIIGACHAADLPYVFNQPQISVGMNQEAMLAETPGKAPNLPNVKLKNEMRKMWFNFAKTGNPSTPAHTWLPYDEKARMTMILGPEIKMESDPQGEQRKLLEPMLKYSLETTATYGGLIDCWHIKN